MKLTMLMASIALILAGCNNTDTSDNSNNNNDFPVSNLKITLNNSAELVPVKAAENVFEDKFYKGSYELCFTDSKDKQDLANGITAELTPTCMNVEPWGDTSSYFIDVQGDARIFVQPKIEDSVLPANAAAPLYPEFTNEVRLSGEVNYTFESGEFNLKLPIRNEHYAGVVVYPENDSLVLSDTGTDFYREGEQPKAESALKEGLFKDDTSGFYYGYYLPPEEDSEGVKKRVGVSVKLESLEGLIGGEIKNPQIDRSTRFVVKHNTDTGIVIVPDTDNLTPDDDCIGLGCEVVPTKNIKDGEAVVNPDGSVTVTTRGQAAKIIVKVPITAAFGGRDTKLSDWNVIDAWQIDFSDAEENPSNRGFINVYLMGNQEIGNDGEKFRLDILFDKSAVFSKKIDGAWTQQKSYDDYKTAIDELKDYNVQSWMDELDLSSNFIFRSNDSSVNGKGSVFTIKKYDFSLKN